MIVLPSPHALTPIPSPADAGEVALIPIPSAGGRRGRVVGAMRNFVCLEPSALRATSFTRGPVA
jgi:hypothetical protein